MPNGSSERKHPSTGCFQIKPCKVSETNPKGMKLDYLLLIFNNSTKINLCFSAYTLLPEIENPHFVSTRARNITRLPIPKRDERLIIWEIERKKIRQIKVVQTHINKDNVQRFLPITEFLQS